MTFSWELDNVDALQCVVKRDLKCSGIRISKKKDVHKNHQAQDVNTSSLFGRALQSCLLVQDEESRCHIPRFLLECTKFLDDHLDMEGIFRISGSKSRQRDLQKNLENGSCIPNDANPADVCSLFKYFFHNLPEPLISSKLQSAFYKCSLIEDIAEQRWVILNICHLLPSLNVQTLRFTAFFLHRVASKSEKNRMDVTNLAKVFTPSLFGSFTALDKKNPEKMIGLQTSMVSLMIENARLIGEVPDWMIEKITGHNQSRENLDRLTSEDELEKSDDNLEESGRLSRRRRKSGPSFQVLVSGLGHSLGILKTASSTENILSTDTHATESPKIMKRKASEDLGSAFTSTKRKALLHKMTTDPQFSKPGLHLHRTHQGTPNQPALGERDAVTADGETLFRYDTPSIVYADDSFAGHTPGRLAGSEFTHKGHYRCQGTPKSKLKRFKELSARKLKRRSLVMNLDGEPFSTKSPRPSKTQGNKRKESKDVGWRLANASPPEGGLDTLKLFDHPVRPSPNFDASGRPRRHNKTPSSPARLLTGASPVLHPSARLHTSDSESDVWDAMKPIRFSAGDSPKVVIVDTQKREIASPKVVVVDTNMISESSITKEYVKKQQEHASQLIGSKLGQERTSPSIYIPDSTRQKIKAAQMVYATKSSMEDEHFAEMADQKISPEDEVHAKDMTPSTSQKSLSSVLSEINVCSHESEVGQFTSEPSEKQPATTYMETAICSPCVYECDDGAMMAVEDLPKDHTDLHSASPVETGKPLDTTDHKNIPIKETHFDDVLMAHPVQQDTKNNRTVKVSSIVEGHSIVMHRPDAGKTTMSKSESIDSGKGCSIEDLYGAITEEKSEMQPPKVPNKQDSLDADLDKGNEEEEMQKELDLKQSKDVQVPSKDIHDHTDIAHQQGNMNRVVVENIEVNKGEENLKTCNENVNDMGKVMSFGEGQVNKDDTFKVPLSVNNTSDSDLQNLINAALKSDMKKSTTLPVHCGKKRRKNSSIVKANIQLFNSFSTSNSDISVCAQGSMRKKSAHNQKETTTVSKPLTPLTKSTSMDSGISEFQTSRHPMSTRSRDLNESFLTAVETKASLKKISSSMENISTPKEEYSASISIESRPIQSSQSMLDISTPASVNRPPVRPVRNVKSMQNVSIPNNKENLSTPASIRRRRPVSQRQKMAFQESDSFAKLKKEKAFEVEEEASSLPLVKPLRDNNSPQLHRTRKPAPLDPRLATPLTPVHLAQHVRLRTPSSSRRPVNIKHRSPVKPVKRLVKSPSPARSKGRLTPERDNRTPKRYPRSPRNPLETASPSVRRQRSAVPVHVQDEWEL
nr:rho GTPase-activating protein 11A-like isoform X1 [Lytechinus pictus]